jgi:hypothetical protein
MIVRWMLQTVGVSVLLTLGALAADRLCRVWGREARACGESRCSARSFSRSSRSFRCSA